MSEVNASVSPVVEAERHATWAELFFDLVVVAGVATLAHVVAGEPSVRALGLYAVLFLALWLLARDVIPAGVRGHRCA